MGRAPPFTGTISLSSTEGFQAVESFQLHRHHSVVCGMKSISSKGRTAIRDGVGKVYAQNIRRSSFMNVRTPVAKGAHLQAHVLYMFLLELAPGPFSPVIDSLPS